MCECPERAPEQTWQLRSYKSTADTYKREKMYLTFHPAAGSRDTWQLQPSDEQGLGDVRSGAPGTAKDGSAYADW